MMTEQLTDQGYVKNAATQVWSRPGFGGIAYNDGDEIEERIAAAIQSSTDRSVLSTELRAHCTDWPSLYHLSASRANIVRPFEDMLKGDVLEIGAGCGAITRYLGECGGRVLAVEGSPRRASIARARTGDLENVEVITDRFQDFQVERRFDVVTLIGVLEYASLFADGDNPFLALLQRAKDYLKPEGRLILAIENRFGLKYFAGAPEDHIGQVMYGVEGSYRKREPTTFGQVEIRELICTAGYPAIEIWLPFPDYKLPVSIVTDQGLLAHSFDASAFAWQSVKRDPQLPHVLNFAPERVWEGASRNGLLPGLSNSFLFIASPSSLNSSDGSVLAYHYSADRVRHLCRMKVFSQGVDGRISVEDSALQATLDQPEVGSDFTIQLEGRIEYFQGPLLTEELTAKISRDGWRYLDVVGFLMRYLEILAELSGGEIKQGRPWGIDDPIPGRYVDALPQNIVVRPTGGAKLIDLEFVSASDTSVGQLVFRSLAVTVHRMSRIGVCADEQPALVGDFIRRSMATAGFSLSQDRFDRYLDWEERFHSFVSGRDQSGAMRKVLQSPLLQEPSLPALQRVSRELRGVSSERDALVTINQNLSRDLGERVAEVAALRHEVDALRNSTAWRLTAPLRYTAHQGKRLGHLAKLVGPALHRGGGPVSTLQKAARIYRLRGLAGVRDGLRAVAGARHAAEQLEYREWVERYDALSGAELQKLRAIAGTWATAPRISILMPVFNPKIQWLQEAIDSVKAQTYPNWELCIADDLSPDPSVRETLEAAAADEPRIRLCFRMTNGHISAASNSALELATGEFISLLDHDDLLAPHALHCVAYAIRQHPDAVLLYSDEDKVDEAGLRSDPYFKSDWNPELFRSQNMICHLGTYKRSLILELGGFREGFDGAQDYDLALRVSERVPSEAIRHIPRVLYHWRVHGDSTASSAEAKPYAVLAGQKALAEHLKRSDIAGTVEVTPFSMYRVRYQIPDPAPRVSIIIPTRNAHALVRQCIDSIRAKTTYPNWSILLVDNGSDESDALRYFSELAQSDNVRVLRDERPFNYSALNNRAVGEADGDLVCLLNNDIEVITPDWLDEMVALAVQPGVGCVGARLWYPNDTLQHGGVILGLGGVAGVAGHSHKNLIKGSVGYYGRAALIQALSAVTAACLVVRKATYLQVGGLNETDLRVAFNDVDFCLRIRQAGYRNVWTPYAELYHHESATRGHEVTPEKQRRFQGEVDYMIRHWGELLRTDPYYSPNLTLDREDFSLAWPPRVLPLGQIT